MFPVITDLDAARIRDLGSRLALTGHGLSGLGPLIDLVDTEAEIVPRERIDGDIVTVNSVVSFRDELSGEHRVTLVYPPDADMAQRRISVLSPVGRALLGRRVGARTSFALPDGTRRELRVLELHYQPEASGDPDPPHFTR